MSEEQEWREGDESTGEPSTPRRPKAMPVGRAILLLVVVLVVAAILAGTGIVGRIHARTEVADQTNALAAPTVTVGVPKLGQPQQEVVLPGNLEAYTDSPIYARTSGYLK